MLRSISRSHVRPWALCASTAVAALLMGWTAGPGAQAADPSRQQQQASLSGTESALSSPSQSLGHEDVREAQNQLIALGFDPGPADGQIGPATTAAAQQYDQSRGGTGRVSVDTTLLARLKSDPGPRLTYDQVAERSRVRQPSHTSSSASASNAFGGIVQQLMPLIGAAISNSNNNSYYGPGPGYYGPGPGYYAPPPPVYYGYGYGGY
jgi:peptidoglycan hydrolase-like protein with peptidoglycan-binding domain